MRFPTVNINGTDRQQLLDGYMKARRALREAQEAVAEIAPHGRDYQTVAGHIYEEARSEHIERMRKLADVAFDLEQLAMHVI